ncbi:DUF1348 family protein [Acetobacter pomorum]|uniref:DUF1348 family protein n=1 Tax=Acetobacter pomorum TaxID=65959 RepID=UPI0005061EF3|nr:hypothetical protein ApDm4_0218 [Acetobacter pomorum]
MRFPRRWRNRLEFITGREEIVAFLKRKWEREQDYRRGNLTEGLYIGLDYEKVCFVEKKFP